MTAPKHPYQSCRDKDCERPYCLIWREARAEGYDCGFEDGFEAGYSEGLDAGARAAERSGR